jgi:hypothetical protein
MRNAKNNDGGCRGAGAGDRGYRGRHSYGYAGPGHRTWTIQHVPLPADGQSAGANGLSCLSASDCVLVGAYGTTSSADDLPLAEGWTGHAWSPEAVPSPAGGREISLNAVSCAAAGRCLAVGNYTHGTGIGTEGLLAEQRDGTTWTAQTTFPLPAKGGGGSLSGVSCGTAANCTAVGTYGDPSGRHQAALAEHWNGHLWTLKAVPVPSGVADSYLSAITCTSADSCLTVGSDKDSLNSAVVNLLAEHWNGSAWTFTSTPLPAGAVKGGAFDAVSCSSASDCTAAGLYWPKNTLYSYTLAERWNGSTWAIESTPSPGTTKLISDNLSAVSCASATSCTAVGTEVENGTTEFPVGEHWNGSTWAVQQTAEAKQAVGLYGVACVSAATCTAVGSISPKGEATNLPLAERN